MRKEIHPKEGAAGIEAPGVGETWRRTRTRVERGRMVFTTARVYRMMEKGGNGAGNIDFHILMLYLPTEEELMRELEQEMRLMEEKRKV